MLKINMASLGLKSLIIFSLLLVIAACGGDGAIEGINTQPGNNTPIISITSPTSGGSQSESSTITLEASANDNEDGNISSNISWSSDIDGNLGIGASISVPLSSGTHTITASVTDTANQSSQDEISYSINTDSGIANLSWTAPTENTDDSELTDLAGFKIYYGESENTLTSTITLDSSATFSLIINNLKTGQTYFFAVTAYNSSGIESSLSDITSKFIQG